MKTRFDAERLGRLDRWMQRYVDEGKFPGSSVLIAEGGEIVHRHACGLRDMTKGAPFAEDTIARIFSMTKPITSVALMMLVERGLIHLDAPLSAVLPEFSDCSALLPGAERIDQTEPCAPPTLHHVVTHTAGFTYPFNTSPVSAAYRDANLGFGPDGPGLEPMVKSLAALPLVFRPGARWEYSVGIDVIGRVVEVVSGKPLDRFFAEEIFAPLGMTDTFFSVPDDRLDRFACLYTSLEGDPLALGTKSERVICREVDRPETSAYRNAVTFSGGGGLCGTIDDYFRFGEMVRGGGAFGGERLLSDSTVAWMRRNHLPGDIASMGPKSFAEMPMEGVGFGIGGASFTDPGRSRIPGNVGDFGWGGIASTYWWTDPVADLTCIFFTQLSPSSSYPNRAELKALTHGALCR